MAGALVILLAVFVPTLGGPSPHRRALRTAVSSRARVVRKRPAPVPNPYARTADPVQVVRPRLALPLRSGLLFDVRSGQVLWAKDPNQPLPIASLTKLMTALVTVTHTDPSRTSVMITRQAIDFTGSGVGLLPLGKRVPETALLYGLLLPSGNDAAIALAQRVAGTQSRFVAEMNATARRMGLTCTHFATVSGVVDRDNRSCATDLAQLAHAVLRQPLLAHIVSTQQAAVPFPIKGGKLYLTNNNPLMLAGYPGVDGIKTGFTTEAGLCFVATARRGRAWLGVVLLHSGNWLTQAQTLLNDGFDALRARNLSPGARGTRAHAGASSAASAP